MQTRKPSSKELWAARYSDNQQNPEKTRLGKVKQTIATLDYLLDFFEPESSSMVQRRFLELKYDYLMLFCIYGMSRALSPPQFLG